jgi:hypothetical protein
MQRHLLPLFRTKYLEPHKVDTFIGFMFFFMFFGGLVAMNLLTSMAIHQGLSSIGFIDFFPAVLQDCGMGSILGVPANSLG